MISIPVRFCGKNRTTVNLSISPVGGGDTATPSLDEEDANGQSVRGGESDPARIPLGASLEIPSAPPQILPEEETRSASPLPCSVPSILVLSASVRSRPVRFSPFSLFFFFFSLPCAPLSFPTGFHLIDIIGWLAGSWGVRRGRPVFGFRAQRCSVRRHGISRAVRGQRDRVGGVGRADRQPRVRDGNPTPEAHVRLGQRRVLLLRGAG